MENALSKQDSKTGIPYFPFQLGQFRFKGLVPASRSVN